MFEGEEWRSVVDFDLYLVSSHGRVRHHDRVEPRSLSINNRGYPTILLFESDGHSRKIRQVNQLVANAFLEPPLYSSDTYIWHIDGNLLNCHMDNLRWEMRARVLEWNEMHRTREPKYRTPAVRNNRTGQTYENAFECGMAEGLLESAIVWRVEKQASSIYDDTARYSYVR